jgi:predicted acylesterase/phospholipase RssA
MRKRFTGSGEVIGVNVSRVPERFQRFDFETSLSGWSVLWSRIAPWREAIPVPRVAETLLRATDVKDLERIGERRAMIDVLVEPDVSDWSLLDFKHFKAISQIGYDEAKRVMESLQISHTS